MRARERSWSNEGTHPGMIVGKGEGEFGRGSDVAIEVVDVIEVEETFES